MDLIEANLLSADRARGRRHLWEEKRFDFFRRVIRRQISDERREVSVLDVGAGDAWLAATLAAAEPRVRVTCWDSGYSEAVLARLRAREGDARGANPRLRFQAEPPETVFPLILMLDVVEHVEMDREFIQSVLERNARPGSRVLFSVPAWPQLWSSHDVQLGHWRRYTPRAARRLLEGAGLSIVEGGGLFFSLLPLRAAQVTLETLIRRRVSGIEGEHHRMNPLVASLATKTLEADNELMAFLGRHRVDIPGLSWWALCEITSS